MRIVAYQHYSYSIDGLREAIDASHIGTSRQPRKSQDEIVSILWTTFFLGIFELMNDSTGHGWQQHIIHGTFMAMKASGPSSCRSMAGMAFFAQARIFEISRTILFNEPTFLTGPEWMALSRDLSIKGNPVETQNPWLPLDSLLDIMVMCSDLRVRAATFIQKQQNTPDAEATSEAIAISTNGYLLREALINWSSAYIPDQLPINNTRETPSCDNLNNDHPGFGPQNSHEVAADMSKLLARIFYASISIYLSGVFDYELFYWQHLRLIVPTLDEILIEQHLNTILALTELGLNRTDLSPLLFLFPLRIAGARSCQQWQRDKISALVAHVNKLFAVAAAIDNDLATVWKLRAVVQNPM
ncbi:hypothetical protein QQS21_002896 [Conoideocrella luteorostrata]|uniref:Uncharacterized protein n=1 Tax=Conoideocrella luteorostrata TaxID=1105319 RepID=A0AAJ0CUB4_9HYPO|nr:hypothetical protein QQS21_002896 [Conoideocrella luteorostrata]